MQTLLHQNTVKTPTTLKNPKAESEKVGSHYETSRQSTGKKSSGQVEKSIKSSRPASANIIETGEELKI
jgi:hypothetical protein